MHAKLKLYLFYAAIAAALAAAFMAYLRPAFIVDLASRFILCS